MKRRHLPELEDLSWWPCYFRDAATDYLVAALRHSKTYQVLVPRLADVLRRSGAVRITDLCSGGGGPWPDLLPALRAASIDLPVSLTDKYPNVAALGRVAAGDPAFRFEPDPVDATDVPERLAGFRTLFTSFHHFRPVQARAILAAAVRDGQGIAIAEALPRSPVALATMVLVPLAVWLLTPAIRPFRWSRLFWTYLVPVIPLAVLFDGVASCFRAYSVSEMLAMAGEADGGDYEWEAGLEHPPGSPLPVPYLIGVPGSPSAKCFEGTQPPTRSGPA